jgi:low affinity Fe/Cu permease
MLRVNEHHKLSAKADEQSAPLSGHAPATHRVHEAFRHFALRTSTAVGTPAAFVIAVVVILAWAITGPLFHFSDTWQLVINTGTTIVTFLTVFLIQNTQNRDARAIHLKLDELIRSKKGARNTVIDLENVTDEELLALEAEFKRLRERGAEAAEREAHAAERAAHAKERKAEAEEREVHAEARKAEIKTRHRS